MKKIVMLLLTILILTGCQEKSYFDQYKGTYTKTTYTNTGLGFIFTLPDGATMLSESDINAEEKNRLEGKTEEEIKILKTRKKLMHATFPGTGVSVYGYLEYFENGKTEESYINDLELYYSSSTDFEPIFGGVYTANLFGETFMVLPFIIENANSVQMIYVKKMDNYILAFTFVYPAAESIKIIQMINAFTEK